MRLVLAGYAVPLLGFPGGLRLAVHPAISDGGRWHQQQHRYRQRMYACMDVAMTSHALVYDSLSMSAVLGLNRGPRCTSPHQFRSVLALVYDFLSISFDSGPKSWALKYDSLSVSVFFLLCLAC